jgi:hypothetical protein
LLYKRENIWRKTIDEKKLKSKLIIISQKLDFASNNNFGNSVSKRYVRPKYFI